MLNSIFSPCPASTKHYSLSHVSPSIGFNAPTEFLTWSLKRRTHALSKMIKLRWSFICSYHLYISAPQLSKLLVTCPSVRDSRHDWVKNEKVLRSVIICGFQRSVFPLYLAYISCTNSTPLAIPGAVKSRPHSLGKALVARGESCRQTYYRSQCTTYMQEENPQPAS